jgi:CheY-like chemotaxis protein
MRMASILVIDDDRAVLATVKILLERNAHTVEAIDNSRAGLKLFETQKFDLLIVDIFMPGMDGFETMNLVRQSRPEVPIIVMSGHQFRSSSEPAPDFLFPTPGPDPWITTPVFVRGQNLTHK